MAFLDWVGQTRFSIMLGEVAWAIPGIQAVHIMAIAVVFTAAFLLDMRVLGVMAKGQTFGSLAQRFSPWIVWGLVILAATGLLLMVAEPTRAITNKYFQLKMLSLAIVGVMTWRMVAGANKEGSLWSAPEGKGSAQLLAVVSLLLWTAIIAAGRFIAYIG